MNLWSPSTLVFLGGFLAVVGTLWSSQKQSAIVERQSALTTRILALQDEVLAFNKGADKLDILPETGSADADGKYTIALANISKLPIYDAFLNITSNIDKPHNQEKVFHEEVGNIGPYVIKKMALRLPPGYYQFDLRCRGGKTTQSLHFVRKPGGGNPDFEILPN